MTDEASLRQPARPVARGRTALGLLVAALLAPFVFGFVLSGWMAFPPASAGPPGIAAILRGDAPSFYEFTRALSVFMPPSVIGGVGPSCIVAACLGVPVIRLARRLRVTSPVFFAAAGLAAASIPGIGLALLIGVGHTRTELVDIAIPLAAAGTAGGLIYWGIAERHRRPPQ